MTTPAFVERELALNEARVRRSRGRSLADHMDEVVVGRDPGSLMLKHLTVRACDDAGKCRSMRVQGKVDTGASHTYIPQHVVKKLRPKKLGKVTAHGLAGSAKTNTYGGVSLDVPGYSVTLKHVREHVRPDVKHVLFAREAMVGTDLKYDGSTGRFSLVPKRARRR